MKQPTTKTIYRATWHGPVPKAPIADRITITGDLHTIFDYVIRFQRKPDEIVSKEIAADHGSYTFVTNDAMH